MPMVNDPGSELIPKGKYLVSVIEVARSYTQSGDERWNVYMDVLEGPHQGKRVKDVIFFTPNATKRFPILKKAFGLEYGDWQPDMLEGKVVRVTVEHKEYQGQLEAKVSFAGYEPAPVKPRDPVADKFKGKPVGGFEPVREPGEDREPLPEHDEPPFPPEDLPF